uniref:Folate-Biopterin Transporter (FBT) Family n=1 Tax=Globisporangium ultimum (strain ATCC 200006 / CBS 805.95 / DAOM BR144) TaxID=431595 RepID=K3WVY9_GLOUD
MANLAAKVDLIERKSYISGVSSKAGDEYVDAKTPRALGGNDLENGALREGGAPSLLSKESFGLLAQYAAVGLVYGTLPYTVVPFLTYYLNMEGTQTTSARALITIPWSLKVFIGILSDCVPIFGYRRRPYMILGWTVCCAMLFTMAFIPLGDPYFMDPKLRKVKPVDLTDEQKLMINYHAPDTGGKYIFLMMLTSLGYLFADVAADAVVVEYAQREPEAIRGRTQTAIYTTRTMFGIFANVILAFGLNSEDYGGDFSFGISFPQVMLILGICTLPVIPLTWFFIKEKKTEAPMFSQYINELWQAIQSRAVYQVIAYTFFSGIFANFTYVANDPMTSYWVKATTLSINVASIIGSVISVITLILTGKYGLFWNWRVMVAITAVAVIFIDVWCTMLTTWDVVRNQWFWLGLPIVENVPSYISFIISSFVVVELAGEGNEGAIYGLLTTVNNLSDPFSKTLTKNINSSFDVYNADIQNDTNDVRRDVTITIVISYAMKLLALCFLPLLPAQKAQTQELKRNGGTNKILGGITIFYCCFALVWSIMTNLFSIFESTKCLKITGGCKN